MDDKQKDKLKVSMRKKDGGKITINELTEWLRDAGVIDDVSVTEEDVRTLYSRMEDVSGDVHQLLNKLDDQIISKKREIVEMHNQLLERLPEGGLSEALKNQSDKIFKEINENIAEFAEKNSGVISMETIEQWLEDMGVFQEGNACKEEILGTFRGFAGNKFTKEEFMRKMEGLANRPGCSSSRKPAENKEKTGEVSADSKKQNKGQKKGTKGESAKNKKEK